MYTPKLMLLIFNCILIIVSGIAVHRGITDTTVSKLQPLESVTDLAYFSKIWLYGGTLLCAITFLGFWGTDAESRMGLITFKILLCFLIGAQIVIICYFSLDSIAVTEQIHKQLKEWMEEYEKGNSSSTKLDGVQSYLSCCEFIPKTSNITKNYPISCCPAENRLKDLSCDEKTAYSETCTNEAADYFHVRMVMQVSFMLRTIPPQVASVIFADMVIAKITLLLNLMQGKLS